MKIGFFDSGIGGLTILRAVRNALPMYDYTYFGDTKNVPYGDKHESQILRLTREGIVHLFEDGAQVVIVACNTASVHALVALQKTLLTGKYANRKILGVVIPTVEAIIENGFTQPLIIGTMRTIASEKYEQEIARIHSPGHITPKTMPTPTLVSFIESGNMESAETYLLNMVTPYLDTIDALVLACTHYTLLKTFLRENISKSISIVSQDEIIPIKLSQYLLRHTEIEHSLSKAHTVKITLSNQAPEYHALCESYGLL